MQSPCGFFREVWGRGRMMDRKLWMFVWVVGVVALVGVTTADEVGFGAGATSRYVRKLAESVDLPYSSPLFAVPPGLNPPQQVINISNVAAIETLNPIAH